jgi:hypothetical protein
MAMIKISGAPLKRAAIVGALLSASVAGVAWAQVEQPVSVGVPVTTDTVTQLQAATTAGQVNDIIAAASVNATPEQIAQLVSIAVAAHPTFATSIVSAAAAAPPEAVNQIASAAIAALPVGQQAALAATIVAAAADAAKVSIASVATAVAAGNPNVSPAESLAEAAQNVSPTELAALTENTVPAARDTVVSFTPTPSADPSATEAIAPGMTAVEPPATDPQKGGAGSPA